MRIHLEMGSLKDPGHHHGTLYLNGSLFPCVKPFDEPRGKITFERVAVLIGVVDIEQQGIHPPSHEFERRHTHHASFSCILRGAVYLLRAQRWLGRIGGAPAPPCVLTAPPAHATPHHPPSHRIRGSRVPKREQCRQAEARDRPPPATPPPRPLPPPAHAHDPACIRCQASCGLSW